MVLVPAGKFLTKPFTLASSINLHLAKDAVILISDDITSYLVTLARYQDSITASGAHDIEISGEGTIDGQGNAWWIAFRSNKSMTHRPFLIKLTNCTRVFCAWRHLEQLTDVPSGAPELPGRDHPGHHHQARRMPPIPTV